MKSLMIETALKARQAAQILGRISSREKDRALLEMAGALLNQSQALIAENAKDVQRAEE